MADYLVVCYGTGQKVIPMSHIMSVKVLPNWHGRYPYSLMVLTPDGEYTTAASGSREFCERLLPKLEALIEEQKTCYWTCVSEPEREVEQQDE